MQYLGGMSGTGIVRCKGAQITRAAYDFDSFFTKAVGVVRSGEIQLPAPLLKSLFGRTDVELITDDGQLFYLSFSGKDLRPETDVAHVDVTDGKTARTAQRHH